MIGRLTLGLLTLLLVGCIDYAEELTLDPRGGGTLKVEFTVDMQPLEDVARVTAKPGEPPPDPREFEGPSEEELRQGFTVEGVELKQLERKQQGKKVKVKAELAFKDLAALERIEGLGKSRKLEFFEEGDGLCRVRYTLDTSNLTATLEDLSQAEDPESVEGKVRAIVQRATDAFKFRAKVTLPGPLVRSNGYPDAEDPRASSWTVEKRTNPAQHESLCKGKVVLLLLIPKKDLPFVKEFKPPEPPAEGEQRQ